jgi:hypothetical protein
MEKHSRRAFLRQGSLALGAAGAVAALPGLPAVLESGGAPATEAATAELPKGVELSEPLVAHVRDLATGEIDVFAGERQITYRDPHLAARLFKATQ